jgi:oxaloacetate decarboxylase alpha subunit/pyruvate carboxylase subunit B
VETRNFVVNGETYTVEIQELSRERVTFTLHGRTYRVTHELKAPNREKAAASAAPGRTIARVRGGAGNAVAAPISGVVVAIECKEGDAVAEGDVVVRIEAMKMQNAIPSPRAGTVKAISVRIGDQVKEGDELLRVEKPAERKS